MKVNKSMCELGGYIYKFEDLSLYVKPKIHPATCKIFAVYSFLQQIDDNDIVVFLDSDAWIQNHHNLSIIIEYFKHIPQIVCISDDNKDHSLNMNISINSGSFIIKKTQRSLQMYEDLIKMLHDDPKFHNIWGYDQHYITEYAKKYPELFYIFHKYVLNSPDGNTLRHNWKKNKKMWKDIRHLLHNFPMYSDLIPNDMRNIILN
jgi:hypothetical protein